MMYKETWKQLGIFLAICLPITWLLMGIGYEGAASDTFVPWAQFLLTFACFMPSIAAIITCLLTKESIWKLQFLPKLQGNTKIYLIAIVTGVFVSCGDLLLMVAVFPDKACFHEDATPSMILFTLLLGIATACISFFVSMGEELGWMGYLFPRLEKVCGTTLALVITGFIRGSWHLMMFVQEEDFLTGFLSLCASNILLGSILVWVTKASKSVVPASVIHAMSNTLPGVLAAYMVLDESIYSKEFNGMDVVSMIPSLIIAVICYLALRKKYKVVS